MTDPVKNSIQDGMGQSGSSIMPTGVPLKVMTLRRIYHRSDGTFGILEDEGTPIILTVERPWKNNAENESCIPAGEYVCARVDSPHFGNTFEVRGVKDRTNILIHKGNTMEDSHGCIVVGSCFRGFPGKLGVSLSGDAFIQFLLALEGRTQFKLVVQDA